MADAMTPYTGLQPWTRRAQDYGPVEHWATDFDMFDSDYVVEPEKRWAERCRSGAEPNRFSETPIKGEPL